MAGAFTSKRRFPKPALLGAAALAVVVVAAWVLQALLTGGAGGSGDSTAPHAYVVKVERDGKLLKQYDIAALHALPQTRIVMDDKEQTGPALSAVLADAEAGAFKRVEVRGAGLRDDGHLSLTAAQIAQRVQLDFTDRGTVKVCGPKLLRPEWVRDVLSIDVR